LCAGVSSGDECIRFAIDLHLDADSHRVVRLFAQGSGGALGHTNVVGCFDDQDPIPNMGTMSQLAAEMLGELVFNYRCLPDKLDGVSPTELVECE
jgi:hypothetical protein